MSNIRNRSALTLSLITNGELLRKGGSGLLVGHPQLALTFTNQTQGKSRLFGARNMKDKRPSEYLKVDTHLVIHVGEYSRKFDDFLDGVIAKDKKMVKAHERLTATESELKDMRAACERHFAEVPGFTELQANLDAAKRGVEELAALRRKRSLTRFENKYLREHHEKIDQLKQELNALRAANPAPVDQRRMDALREREEGARMDVEEVYDELYERMRKDKLGDFLKKNGVANLDGKMYDAIARGDAVLYALEINHPAWPAIETDRCGMPYCMKLQEVHRDEKDEQGNDVIDRINVLDEAPCDQTLSIPWDYVFTGMGSDWMNKPYLPGARGQKHFVQTMYTPDQSEEEEKEKDHYKNIDNVVIGRLPDHTEGKRKPGWAVIIRKKQWIEILRSLDIFRSSGLIEQFLKFCPDPNPPSRKSSSQAVEKAGEDKPERKADQPLAEGTSVASVPTASEAAEEPGQTAESSPVEEPRQPEEPAGTSASAAN